jgi:hypothetical protein
MANVPINRIGGSVDTTGLTAGPGDVLSPEIFIGAGSDENQQGTIPLRGSPTYTLPINGSQTLQAGHYTGGTISQSTPTMGAQSIGPGAQMITIPTAGKYMTGNITIKTTKNLIPSVIKKGVTVGGVTGTFEGYVITDPNTLYKYGTFNGIQSVTAFRYFQNDLPGVLTLERDNIKIYSATTFRSTSMVFDAPINLTGLSKITVNYENSTPADIEFTLYRNHVTNYVQDFSSGTMNPNIGQYVTGGHSFMTSGGNFVLNVASYTGNAYLYINIIRHENLTTRFYLVQCE